MDHLPPKQASSTETASAEWLPAPGESQRLRADLSGEMLRSASFKRAWERVRGHHWLTSVQALLRIAHAEDARRLEAQALGDTDAYMRQLVQGVNDVLWLYEPHSGRFLYVSPAYEWEWMRSPQSLYADARQWFSPVHRDDRLLLKQAFDRLAAGQTCAVEYRATLLGRERWIAQRAAPAESQHGQARRIVGISQDITARKNDDVELMLSSRRKDVFLATLAHELRNPLEPLRCAAALLARTSSKGPSPEQKAKAVAIVERQMNHLSRLIDDMFDLARINHGKLGLRSEAVRLDDVIDAAVEANQAFADERRLNLRVQSPRETPWVLGDSARLTQVFSNLVNNAVKFSAEGGTVLISVRPLDGSNFITVSVKDDGVGIAADVIDSVFDLFTQVEQPRADYAGGRGGLGIGLSVVRSLVELQGGTVSVHSGGSGQGSDFVVSLAAAQPPRAASVAIQAPAHSRNCKRILVVDDNQDAAQTLHALLRLEGHSVTLAFSGQAALDQAELVQPEVVILDIGLPDIGGHELARKLRANARLSATVLVALTGEAPQSRHGHAAEFDHHFVKPADWAALMNVVRK